MIDPKRDTSGVSMVLRLENSKQERPVYIFSTKYNFNLPYIGRYMVNIVDGMNIEVLGGCVDKTIVYLRN